MNKLKQSSDKTIENYFNIFYNIIKKKIKHIKRVKQGPFIWCTIWFDNRFLPASGHIYYVSDTCKSYLQTGYHIL